MIMRIRQVLNIIGSWEFRSISYRLSCLKRGQKYCYDLKRLRIEEVARLALSKGCFLPSVHGEISELQC